VRVATVIDAVPLFPSLIAVTVVDPAAPPVTNPLALTVAAVVLLLAQLTTRPVSALPDASVVVAVNCTVLPTLRLASAGVTTTEATGVGGAIEPLLPQRASVNPAVTVKR